MVCRAVQSSHPRTQTRGESCPPGTSNLSRPSSACSHMCSFSSASTLSTAGCPPILHIDGRLIAVAANIDKSVLCTSSTTAFHVNIYLLAPETASLNHQNHYQPTVVPRLCLSNSKCKYSPGFHRSNHDAARLRVGITSNYIKVPKVLTEGERH
jgi:hypothetical protein